MSNWRKQRDNKLTKSRTVNLLNKQNPYDITITQTLIKLDYGKHFVSVNMSGLLFITLDNKTLT